MLVLTCALGAAACDSSTTSAPPADTENAAANVANAAATEKKRPAYCFFKDAETEGWRASRDGQGNVVVEGRAYRSDPRYKAELAPADISGTTATISPTISQNGGYAAPENWWDVSATIPDSRAVTTVKVQCGSKLLAELGLQPAR
ncbi:hypothetical protein GCM10023325_23710 [Sphingomonas lutea]